MDLPRYEKLYRMLLDAIPSSVLLIDRNMTIVAANKNFLKKNPHIGQRLDQVFPDVILEHMNLIRQVHHVFENNEPTIGQRLNYRAPGVPSRIYYCRLFPFAWEGEVENVMLLMDDVTEQVRLNEEVRRVERHLASIVESASDIILSTDIEGKICTWNPAAERISGYRFEEVRGHLFYEYCAVEHREEAKRLFARMRQTDVSQMSEWSLVTSHNEHIPVSWVCSPMKNEINKTTGVVAVGRDLTERRKFEIQLLQSQKLAALGVMAGGIAHEIRNPLAISASGAQFLMEESIDTEFRKECARKILLGIQRASVIIENLLRFASPSVKTEVMQVDIVALLSETLVLVANQAAIQKIVVRSLFPKDSVTVSGIPGLLQQVYLNLLLNAINAMPNGGTLTTSVEKTNTEVLIRVADTGIGIARENLDKIFDPFYTTSPVGKGTGLGLSICYSIVKQHFGTIEVESAVGLGSTFTVRLAAI